MSCTIISHSMSNQCEVDFWGPSEINSIPTCEKITVGINSDGICPQPVSSSRQEWTITPPLMKPQTVQPV